MNSIKTQNSSTELTTFHLDNEINELRTLQSRNEISEHGLKKLEEFESIKKLITSSSSK